MPIETEKKRILVTGGAGFIGRHAASAFLHAGHTVWVLDVPEKKEEASPDIPFCGMDLLSEDLFDFLVQERFDVVCHHAAQIHVKASLEDPVFDVRQNVLATVHLADASRRAGVSKILFASSGGAIYGETRKPAKEDDPANPLSIYGVDKLAAEEYLKVFSKQFGMDVIALRYANVYGPGQAGGGEGGVVAVFLSSMLQGLEFFIFGDGGQTRDFVYVSDVAEANLAALNYRGSGVFNIATGRAVSINELFEKAVALTGYSKKPKRTQRRLGDIEHSVLDPSRAKEKLGWAARTSLEEGLKRTLEWLRKGGDPCRL